MEQVSTKICILARAFIVDANHILLCKTKILTDNFYFLPGGHVEHGETVKSALGRELNEEIGHDFTINSYLDCVEHFHSANNSLSPCHNHEYNFIFSASNPDFKFANLLQQPEQGQILEWLSLDELHNIDIKPGNLGDLIPKWLVGGNNTVDIVTHLDDIKQK